MEGATFQMVFEVFVAECGSVDEYGRTRLDMSTTTRRFVIGFAHQLVSKVLLAPTVTKDGPTFTEYYFNVFRHNW